MKKYQIYFILFCIMVGWGFNVVATKVLAENFMPVTMTALRIFTAGISVFILLFFLNRVRMLTKKELLYVFFAGLFNVVIHHYFLAVGLTKTTASNGGLILGMGPILTAVLAVLFLGSTLTFPRVIGIILGVTGVAFIVLEGDGGITGISIGDLYIFLSILSQATSFILIRKISKTLDPRLMTGYMLLIGSIILFAISLVLEPHGLVSMTKGSIRLWSIFAASAIIATALGHMMYNYAIGKIGAAESAVFINFQPFFSLVGAAIFIGEKISISQMAGFVFILLGVMLGSGVAEDLFRNKLQGNRYSKRA
jgi:drug/metabolite transporter (DMT)-like permease